MDRFARNLNQNLDKNPEQYPLDPYYPCSKKVVSAFSVLFYTKNLHKGGWHLRVNQ